MSRLVEYLFKGRDNVTPTIRKMDKEMKRFEATSKRSMSGFRRAGIRTRMAINSSAARFIGAAAITGFTVMAIKEHAKLEDSMNKIQLRSRMSGEEVNKYKGKIQALSVETGQSAVAIAESMADLIGAGNAVAESYEMVRIGAMGAVVAQADLQTIIAGLQPTMAAFGYESKETAKVMAMLRVATDEGTIELGDLASAMSTLTAPSKKIKASLSDVLAVIEQLSIKGVPNAAEATTAVARFFDVLGSSDVQKKFAKFAKKQGFNFSFRDESGNMKPLIENLKQIDQLYDSLASDPIKQDSFLETVFGKNIRSDKALRNLLGNLGDIIKSQQRIADADTATFFKDYKEQLKRASVQLARLNVMFKMLGAETGEMLMPVITFLVKKLGELNKATRDFKSKEPDKGFAGFTERVGGTMSALEGQDVKNPLVHAVIKELTDPYKASQYREEKGTSTVYEMEEKEKSAQRREFGKRLGLGMGPVSANVAQVIQSTGRVSIMGATTIEGLINAKGPLRSTGAATILGPTYFTGPVYLKKPAKVDP